MKENDIKNAGKAITITTVLTLFIATFEMVNALGFYKQGMNLLDIASYVQANKWIFAFIFIFGNLVLFPGAWFLYKANGISLKKEIFERENLGGDIFWGIILATIAGLFSLLWVPVYKGCTELAFVEDGRMGVGVTILYVISLVFVSGIFKEIYYRGFATRFCGPIFGEVTALLLFNMLFALLDWYNFGYSFVLGLVCIFGYQKRKRMVVPMIIHGGTNLISIIYIIVMGGY
ncbi:MAG: CPBP family intramembrane metalloprotease [Lachnospiraceae bacterium]|nr:CPBP family intramembrane metalloprotease [Lachnospiraceae bacterium]